jgi:hypothetical protein
MQPNIITGCSIAQSGCSIAQLVARCTAGQSSNPGSAYPGRFFPLSESNEETERGLGEWRRKSVLYECNYECM